MQSSQILKVTTVFPHGQHLRHSFPETLSPRWNSEHLNRRETPYQTRQGKTVLKANSVNIDATKDLSASPLAHASSTFEEMNTFLGLPHSQSDWTSLFRRDGSELTHWQRNNSVLYRGLQLSAAVNVADESFLAERIYHRRKVEVQHSMEETISSLKHWWNQLEILIHRHYEGVGKWIPDRFATGANATLEIGMHYRDVSQPAKYLMEFEKALEELSHDADFLKALEKSRPKGLEDLFGIFIEMEGNKVNAAFCPRCSQPYAETKFCGQGHRFSQYRKYQGLWNTHQPWTSEWYQVIANRAEALFLKCAEHPLFGTKYHSQRQVDALMRVYAITHQRGRANSFMARIRGSTEFQLGIVKENTKLLKSYNELLDSTCHPTLITHEREKTAHEGIISPYTNLSLSAPQQSVKKLRIEMEMARFRREQKEEGVVRVPPHGWDLRLDQLKEYSYTESTTPHGDRITNWRDVKSGIEKSFHESRRLPDSAYIKADTDDPKAMLRWLHFCEFRVKNARTAEEEEAIEHENDAERRVLKQPFLFPTTDCYRWFEVDDFEVNKCVDNRVHSKGVHNIRHGEEIGFQIYCFEDPRSVPFLGGRRVDITNSTCEQYGFLYGSKLLSKRSATTLIIVGVDRKKNVLIGITSSSEIVELGYSIKFVHEYISANDYSGSPQGYKLTHPAIEKHRIKKEEMKAMVIGSRKGTLWVQCLPELGVAAPISDFLVEGSLCIVSSSRKIPHEPESWKIPFRNNWAEQDLLDAIEAPWKAQPLAPLIVDRMTPKRKIFGYTQHNSNRDFMTKEYHDRLVSKQFFSSPKAFEIVPDVYEKVPSFGGKWDSAFTSGLPSIDRNELTHGWSQVEEIPDFEVKQMEQAIRDISGSRPGNYYKRASELSRFSLKESWWNVKPYWAFENNLEMGKRPIEQRLINHNALPFGGRIPSVGAAGIGERLKYVTDNLEKGFGVGPAGFSPVSDKAKGNTLDFELQTQERMNNSSIILQLFQRKVRKKNLTEAQVIWSTGLRMKECVIALEEWSKLKKRPSLGLLRMLADFLKDDIKAFNETLGSGLEPIVLPVSDVSSELKSYDNWVERDFELSLQANCRESMHEVHGDADVIHQEGYMQYKYVQTRLFGRVHSQNSTVVNSNNPGKSVRVDDSSLDKWCRQVFVDDFADIMAKYINADIPKEFLKAVRGSKEAMFKEFRASNKWITSESLRYLLMEARMPIDDAKHILLQGPDVHFSIEHNQHIKKARHSLSSHLPSKSGTNEKKIFHVASLLKWNGSSTSRGHSQRRDDSSKESSDGTSSVKKRSLLDALSGKKSEIVSAGSAKALRMSEVLENFAMYFGDGAAMDMQYQMKQNIANDQLFWEFLRFTHPLLLSTQEFLEIGSPRNLKYVDLKSMRSLYQDYTMSCWVPSASELSLLVNQLLKNISLSLSGELKDKGEFARLISISNKGDLQVLDAPPDSMPFEFETAKIEQHATQQCFVRLGVICNRQLDDFLQLHAPDRSDHLNYKEYLTSPLKGKLSYGDSQNEQTTAQSDSTKRNPTMQILHINTQFCDKLYQACKNSNNIDKLLDISPSSEVFAVCVRKLILRHLPLLPTFYKAWKSATSSRSVILENIAEEADRFKQIFEVDKDLHARVSSDTMKHDGIFRDDLNLFNQNTERYWKEIMRTRYRMGTQLNAHENKNASTMSGPRSGQANLFYKDSTRGNPRPTQSADRKQSLTSTFKNLTPQEKSTLSGMKGSPASSVHKTTQGPNLRGVPSAKSPMVSSGRGRRPTL